MLRLSSCRKVTTRTTAQRLRWLRTSSNTSASSSLLMHTDDDDEKLSRPSNDKSLLLRRSYATTRQPLFLFSHQHQRRRYYSSRGGDDDDDKKQQKPNLDRDILRPASRGELTHKQRLPKHLARKPKGTLHHETRRAGGVIRGGGGGGGGRGYDDDEEFWLNDNDSSDNDDKEQQEEEKIETPQKLAQFQQVHNVPRPRSFPPWTPEEAEKQQLLQALAKEEKRLPYHAPEVQNESKYYWHEEEYELLTDVINGRPRLDGSSSGSSSYDDASIVDSQKNKVTKQQQGDDDSDSSSSSEEEEDASIVDTQKNKVTKKQQGGGEFDFEDDILKALQHAEKSGEEEVDYSEELFDHTITDLPQTAATAGEFSQTMMNVKGVARIDYGLKHWDSRREPHFMVNRSRRQPPLEWVQAHGRYLYISGLPPALKENGETVTIEEFSNSPVYQSDVQQRVAELMSVDSLSVFACTPTSAFVGYESPHLMSKALQRGPAERSLSLQPKLMKEHEGLTALQQQQEKLRPKDRRALDFINEAPEATLVLEGVPPGSTVSSLTDLLLQKEQVRAVYDIDALHFYTSACVLIRFGSAEQAASALESDYWKELSGGGYTVRVERARRELVHKGYTQYRKVKADKMEEIRVPGPRLIVDSDMPGCAFYRSHVEVLQVQNAPALTEEQWTDLLQPSCARRRLPGSIEFVTDEYGTSLNMVYLGFERVGEGEKLYSNPQFRKEIMKAAGTTDGPKPLLRLLRDRIHPGLQSPNEYYSYFGGPEQRPERSIGELLSDLNDWERHVDPDDLRAILDSGFVTHESMDTVLRSIRYKNPTFGPLDQGIATESRYPTLERGAEYKEIVQTYIREILAAMPTREEPGEMYRMLHYENEPLSMDIFDNEPKRQEQIKQAIETGRTFQQVVDAELSPEEIAARPKWWQNHEEFYPGIAGSSDSTDNAAASDGGMRDSE